VANLLGEFLKRLCGPKCQGLKVANPTLTLTPTLTPTLTLTLALTLALTLTLTLNPNQVQQGEKLGWQPKVI